MKCYVRLVVSSSFQSVAQISERLDIKWDRSWTVGDVRGKASIIEVDNGLILDSTEDKEKEVGVHVRSFIARLKGKECKFEEFSNLSGCTVQIACSIYYDEEPPLLLDKDLISWVGSIGGSIDIDIYHVERAVELGTES